MSLKRKIREGKEFTFICFCCGSVASIGHYSMTESGGSPVFRRVTSELPKIIVGVGCVLLLFACVQEEYSSMQKPKYQNAYFKGIS